MLFRSSLRARGEGREAVIYTREQEKARIDAQREVLHRDIHPQENAANLKAWQAQKPRESLTDLSREAIIDHVRDRFWLRDQSPARDQELAKIERDRDREIQKIQNDYKLQATVFPPILPLLVGLVVWARRRIREREGVSRTRMRL